MIKQVKGGKIVEIKNTEGSTGDLGEEKTEEVCQASGTGSNDEVLDITVGKINKKKRKRKSKEQREESG